MTSMRTLAAQPPMKEASTRAFIGFVACCTEGSLLKKNGRSLNRIKEDAAFFKRKKAAAGQREFDLDSIIHSAPGCKRECGFPHNGATVF